MFNYVWGLAVFASVVVGGKLLIWLLDLLAQKHKTSVHKEVIQKLDNHILLVFILLGVYLGLLMMSPWSYVVKSVFKSIIAIVFFTTLSLVFQNYAHLWMKHLIEVHKLQLNQVNIIVFRKFLRFLAVVMCIFTLFWIWRVDPRVIVWYIDLINTNLLLRTIVTFGIYLILARVVVVVCKKYIQGMLRLPESSADKVLDIIERAASWIIVLYGLYFALHMLGHTESIVLPLIITAIVFIIMHTIMMVVDSYLVALEERLKQEVSLFSSVHNGVKGVVILFGFIFILGVWGVNIHLILGIAGIVVIILGFIFKEVIANITLGLSLVAEGTLRIDKKIQLETGEVGIVKDISSRATALLTRDGVVYIPHTRLAYMKVITLHNVRVETARQLKKQVRIKKKVTNNARKQRKPR